MRAQRGFTLVELMVVVALFSVIAALTIIGMSGTRRTSELDAFARELMNEITVARRRAVQTGRTYVLDVRPGSISYCEQDPANPAQNRCPSAGTLESSRPFVASSDARIAYYANDMDNPTLGARPTRRTIGSGTFMLLLPNGSCDSLPQTPAPDGFSLYLQGTSDTSKRRLVTVSPTAARPRITDTW